MEKHRNTPEYKKEYEKMRPQMEVLHEIIRVRKELGMSQAELAERMGKAQPSIARIESGSYVPSLKTLYEIADATGKKLEVKFI